jgi:hypothetical protein
VDLGLLLGGENFDALVGGRSTVTDSIGGGAVADLPGTSALCNEALNTVSAFNLRRAVSRPDGLLGADELAQ